MQENLVQPSSLYLEQLKNLKDEEFKKFISNCWLILPGDFPELLEKYKDIFEKFAKQLSDSISQDPHMLQISLEEIMTAFSERQSNFVN